MHNIVALFKTTGLRWLWLAVLMFVFDQATKYLVISNMQLYQSIEILPLLNFTYVQNPGAAFSFLADQGGWQRWFFSIIAFVVSGLILYWLRTSKQTDVMLPVAFCLVLSGALGNLVDRLAYGYVIDFIDVFYGQWHWPAFNIADSAIFVGAAIIIIDALRNNGTEE
jgi:signal peptidase II